MDTIVLQNINSHYHLLGTLMLTMVILLISLEEILTIEEIQELACKSKQLAVFF
jgi:hypothetical protein